MKEEERLLKHIILASPDEMNDNEKHRYYVNLDKLNEVTYQIQKERDENSTKFPVYWQRLNEEEID